MSARDRDTDRRNQVLTIEQIIEYLEKTIAEDLLRGDKIGLKRTQMAAGVVMAAAEANSDKETAQRFRLVAAHAANKLEELENENG
jgi:hypothetical protein